jgi:hypothetical protein
MREQLKNKRPPSSRDRHRRGYRTDERLRPNPGQRKTCQPNPSHIATIEFIDASCLAVDSTEWDPDRSIGQ